MATKFPEAHARLMRNRYVCKRCKSVIRAPSLLVTQGRIKCRRCRRKTLRSKRKK